MLDEEQAAAHASIAQHVEAPNEEHVKALAKRLPNIKQHAPDNHQWQHSVRTTNNNLAKVMLALCDTIERWCLKTGNKEAAKGMFKFLCDSCCDTHLMALTYVKVKGLKDKIDRSIRRNIGTASEGIAFKTEGTIDISIKIRDVDRVWHMLELTWHITNIGHKCLVNTTALRKSRWKFVQQNNVDGSDGTCFVAPNGKVFPLSGNDHSMLLLPTQQAPIISKVKPSMLRRWAQHILHLAKYSNKPAPPEPKC